MQPYDSQGKCLYLSARKTAFFMATAVVRGEEVLKGELVRRSPFLRQMG
jgi:hypothetical protein